jgi:general secretion pathway protein I
MRNAAAYSFQGLGARGWVLARTEDKGADLIGQMSFFPAPSTQHPAPDPGFTLLEVLVAMAVLAVALVSLLGLYNRSLLLTIRAQRLSAATLLVQEMLARTQLEGMDALRVTAGDFADLHPGQYPEFRWYRAVRPTVLEGLWELRVGVSWGEREDETCELTLFTPLEGS